METGSQVAMDVIYGGLPFSVYGKWTGSDIEEYEVFLGQYEVTDLLQDTVATSIVEDAETKASEEAREYERTPASQRRWLTDIYKREEELV